jgi:hypothetical protein
MTEENQPFFSLHIDPIVKSHLSLIAKWARFLAIMGMLLLVLALVATVLTLTIYQSSLLQKLASQNRSASLDQIKISTAAGSVILVTVCFFPLLFLLQFSGRLRSALAANDQTRLNEAFLLLKKYFRYLAIVILVAVTLYILSFVFRVMLNTAMF